MALFYQGERARSEALLEEATRSPTARPLRVLRRPGQRLAARGERARAEKVIAAVIAGPWMDHHVANSLARPTPNSAGTRKPCAGSARAVETGLPCLSLVCPRPAAPAPARRSRIPALPGGRAEDDRGCAEALRAELTAIPLNPV